MNIKAVSFTLLVTQAVSVMPPALAGGFLNPPVRLNENTSADALGSIASGLGATASGSGHFSDSVANQAAGAASGLAGDQLAGWLRQFGTARVNLSVDRHGDWDASSVDWLVPLWQSPQNILFTQLGFRSPNGRRTLNTGIGVRTFSNDWMFGTNVFIDNDFSGQNRRVGIGAEAWRDYLKLSANAYFGITDWHQSVDFEDYDERPADGWDIRTQAWLPTLPQLGGQLVYEKYHGNSVALIDKDTRRRNPSTVTAGLSYTPVPLVSLGIDHRMPAGSHDDTQLSIKFRYQFGTPWQTQLSPDAVSSLRSLAGSRYDLVERNNTIVLDYRKQNLISLRLPERLEGEGGSDVSVTAQVYSKYALDSLDWSVSSVTSAGGTVSAKGERDIRLTLPAWQDRGVNQYRISAVARDARGNRSGTASTVITVSEPLARLADGSMTVVRNNADADGVATNEVLTKVTDASGRPVSGQKVSFTATNGATVSVVIGATGTDGIARARLTSLTGGESLVTASLANGQATSATITFTDAAHIAAGDLLVTQNNAAADGVAKNRVQARVTNASGQPLAGQTVSFTATNGAKVTDISGTTGDDGTATASLTSTTAGNSVVTAALKNGKASDASVTFSALAVIAPGDMTITKNNAAADGVAVNTAQVRITDAAGKPLPGQTVSFTATNGAKVTVVSGTTGTDGTATVNLTSLMAGNSVVTATLSNGVSASATTTFTALSGIAFRDVTILRNNALADGKDMDQVSFKVTDGTGTALSGQELSFVATNGAVLSTSTAQTGDDGTVTLMLASITAGDSKITAKLANGTSATATVTFITPAKIEAGSFVVTTNNAVADGVATNAVQLKVVNGNGEAVSGQQVTFTAMNGATVTTSTVTTGSDGLAGTTLTSITAGDSQITAKLANGTSATATVTFITPAKIEAGSFVVTTNNAVADGVATNAVQLKVVNGSGEAVSGQQVTFTATNGATVTISTVTTGSDGLAGTTLTSITAGDSQITAKLANGTSATATVTFITPAKIEAGSFVVTTNNAVADGVATNAVQLKVVNGSGEAVSGQQVTFTATNGATVTISTVTTGSDGLARTMLISGKAGNSTVTATLIGSGESGTVTLTFAPSYTDFSGITANGQRFSVTSGFPKTGFAGAHFTLTLPGSASADNYVWTTSASWLSVSAESGTSTATVNFGENGTGSAVTITATPSSGTGLTYRYTINLKKWFIFGSTEKNRVDNTAYCTTAGYGVPSYTEMTNASAPRQDGTRAVGSLWSEWGDLGRYPIGIRSNYTYMSSEYDNTAQYSVRLTTGWIYYTALSVDNAAACVKSLM